MTMYTHLVSPTFILNGSISAGISSLDTDASPSDLDVMAPGFWTVRLATIAVAACLCLLGRDGPTDEDKSGSIREL